MPAPKDMTDAQLEGAIKAYKEELERRHPPLPEEPETPDTEED